VFPLSSLGVYGRGSRLLYRPTPPPPPHRNATDQREDRYFLAWRQTPSRSFRRHPCPAIFRGALLSCFPPPSGRRGTRHCTRWRRREQPEAAFWGREPQNLPRPPADPNRPPGEGKPRQLFPTGHQVTLRMPDLLHMARGDYSYRQAQTSRCECKWGYPQSPARRRSSDFAAPHATISR
jgi:hypothetical protein